MSPLTKAFVVLVTILSILLVTLVVPFVAQVDDLRAEVDTAQAISSAASVTITDLQAQNTMLREGVAAKEANLNATIRQLESDIAEAKGNETNLEAQLAKAQADNDAIRATIISGSESQKTNTALLETTLGQLSDVQAKLVERSTENTQLIARNNQLEADRSALENQSRSLREQLTALNEEVASLESAVVSAGGAIPSAGAAVAAVPTSTDPVYGAITGQGLVAGGKAYVQLNIGSSDGVMQNQRFVAFRGDNELVANLEVLSVDASESVAIILGQSRRDVQTGDSVVSAPNL
ncbi:MAG: hypothetical protein AAF328_08750 [Planctomycetota bacterium]